MGVVMNMEAENYTLRPLDERDALRMLEWLHDEEVTRYLSINGKDSTMDEVLRFIQDAQDETVNLHRAITDDRDNYLGTVSLKNIDNTKKEAEYAISMHQSAIGTGAADAASKMITCLAFDNLRLNRIYLYVMRSNSRAVKFYNKMGYRYTHSSFKVIKGKKEELIWYEVKNEIIANNNGDVNE